MIKRILRATTILAGLFSTAAYADFTDLKFGQAQIADSQWNVNACMNTTTCQIYSKNPGTVYKIPFTTGQLTWAAGDYVKFSETGNATNPYNAIQYNSAGVQKVVMGTGHIINMGTDYFFFVGNDNNTGQLFSMTSGFANTSGLSWTGTLNPSLAQVNTLAAGGSTTPLAAGQAVTVTPTPTAPNITSASTNTNFATGTLGPWTAGGGTGTQTSTTYNANQGVGVSVVSGMTGFNTQGQGAGVPNSYSWTVTPPVGTYMASLQPTNGTVTSGANINTFDAMAASLGLSASSKTELAAAISASGGPATNAAWIKQDITLTNGQTFHMAWQYVSTDYVPFNDGSMTSLVNKSGSTVATINGTNKEFALLGFTSPGTGNYSTGSYGATGWQLANYTANADGTYTLGFAVFNQGDTANSPILFVTKEVGTTLNFTTSFGAIAPNAGSTAPNNATTPSAPTVVSTAPGTPIVTSSNSVGTPTITSVTNTNLVNSVDANGNPVVTTYFTVTSTTTTPNTVTTTTTPVTVTTYSDGTTSTANGTPVVTTSTTNSVTSNTTQPAIQNVATTKDVVTTNTTSGIATTASSTVNWATTSNSIITYTKNLVGKMLNINQNTTVITDHPSTTTTVVTTPITTVTTHTPTTTNKNAAGATTSVTTGTPVNTSNTIYQNVSSAVNNDTYTQTSNNVVRGVSATGFSDAVKMRNTNPFLVDTLSQKDGAWADPTASYYKTTGSMSKGGLSAGYQWTVENNSFGIAGTYVAGKSGGLTGATVDSTDYNVTGYILSKQEDFWVKGSIGAGLSTYNGTTSIPLFALYNNAKFKQNTYYADLTLYTADTYYGFRPLAGVTLNQSQINNVVELGSSLLSTTPSGKSTSVNPYVGIRYDLDNNISFETRVTQTKDFKTVGGIRAVAKTEIDKGIFLNATIGFDKGTGYTGALGTIGLKIEF